MKTTDTTERIQAIADTKYDGDDNKSKREVNFATETYPGLVDEYGQESVATSVIDSFWFTKTKRCSKICKTKSTTSSSSCTTMLEQVKMRFVKDQTGKFALNTSRLCRYRHNW